MTEKEIETIRALCEAATKGPWWVEDGYVKCWIHLSFIQEEVVIKLWTPPPTDIGVSDQQSAANAAFIAAARTGIPALIEALEDAKSELFRKSLLVTGREERLHAAEARAKQAEDEREIFADMLADMASEIPNMMRPWTSLYGKTRQPTKEQWLEYVRKEVPIWRGEVEP